MVETIVEQLETRVGQLIDELGRLRDTSSRLEGENDSLRITLSDYEQIKAELDEARTRLEEVDSVSADLDELRAAAAERDELLRPDAPEAGARACRQNERRDPHAGRTLRGGPVPHNRHRVARTGATR